MKLKSGLVRTASVDVEAIRRELEQAGYAIFVLPAEGVVDRDTFFDAVRETLPVDPPLVGKRSWDAMSDSLWEGLFTLPERCIAILWLNATAMANAASSDYEMATNVLMEVSDTLANPLVTNGSAKNLR